MEIQKPKSQRDTKKTTLVGNSQPQRMGTQHGEQIKPPDPTRLTMNRIDHHGNPETQISRRYKENNICWEPTAPKDGSWVHNFENNLNHQFQQE